MEASHTYVDCGGEYNWHSPGKKNTARTEQKQTIGSFLYDCGAQALLVFLAESFLHANESSFAEREKKH